jgi:hypothetical protein
VVKPVVAVANIEEEDAHIGQCQECRLPWTFCYESVTPESGRWFDKLEYRCAGCGRARDFLFDITRFFQARPGVWSKARGLWRGIAESEHVAAA